MHDFPSTLNGEDRFKLASKRRPYQVVCGWILHGNDSDCNPLASVRWRTSMRACNRNIFILDLCFKVFTSHCLARNYCIRGKRWHIRDISMKLLRKQVTFSMPLVAFQGSKFNFTLTCCTERARS